MIKAKDIISRAPHPEATKDLKRISSEMSVMDVLPSLLDTHEGMLAVEDDGEIIGVIDTESLIVGMGRLIAMRDDSSEITVECHPADYSASHLAQAVEDTDTHLVDLLTVPTSNGRLEVTLRVRRQDPGPVVSSLERYGYTVTDFSAPRYSNAEVSFERLLELNRLLSV